MPPRATRRRPVLPAVEADFREDIEEAADAQQVEIGIADRGLGNRGTARRLPGRAFPQPHAGWQIAALDVELQHLGIEDLSGPFVAGVRQAHGHGGRT